MNPKCPECGERYGVNGGHCRGGAYGGCCRSFTGGSAFDAHRTGPGTDRRCIDVAAVEPWRETARGWTPSPEYDFEEVR